MSSPFEGDFFDALMKDVMEPAIVTIMNRWKAGDEDERQQVLEHLVEVTDKFCHHKTEHEERMECNHMPCIYDELLFKEFPTAADRKTAYRAMRIVQTMAVSASTLTECIRPNTFSRMTNNLADHLMFLVQKDEEEPEFPSVIDE